jgi:phage tail sheath gpL-like
VGTIPVTVYPLEDGYEAVTAVGTITPSGTATADAEYRVRVAGVLSEPFVIEAGAVVANDVAADMVAAINAVLEQPVVATDTTGEATLTVKWAGVTGNDVEVEVIPVLGETVGVVFTIVQPTGGLVNPDVTDALAQMGNVWESMVLNALNIADTTTLNLFQDHGEGRWGELVRKPYVCFTGNTAVTVSSATAVSDARKTDRINAQLVAPGSVNLPCVVAARQLARIAKVANNNPPTDYGAQRATGLIPGDDGDQWTYLDRDSAVKKGSSTVEVNDGVVSIGDVVTFYHPTGNPLPEYRFVCDIVKLQNIIFNLDLIFSAQEWAGAPLIPDDQPTVNPNARKPKSAKTQANAMIDSLGLNAIISDPKTAKKATVASINSQNPKRLDLEVTVQLAGNSNIKGVTLNFGFFFGTAAVVA